NAWDTAHNPGPRAGAQANDQHPSGRRMKGSEQVCAIDAIRIDTKIGVDPAIIDVTPVCGVVSVLTPDGMDDSTSILDDATDCDSLVTSANHVFNQRRRRPDQDCGQNADGTSRRGDWICLGDEST